MFGAIMNEWGKPELVTADVLQDMVWNLQTWPLDLVDWPTHNSHRLVRAATHTRVHTPCMPATVASAHWRCADVVIVSESLSLLTTSWQKESSVVLWTQ